MKKVVLAAFCALLIGGAPSSSHAGQDKEIEVVFSPKQGATKALVRYIGEAKKSIRVAAYGFTSPEIAQALVNAHRQGIDVRVVLDKSNQTAKYSSATFLANQEVPLRIDHHYKIMHNKYIIVDGVSIETGSFNFTKAAETGNAENAIILRNKPEIAAQYTKDWERLWEESEAYIGPGMHFPQSDP